MKDKIRIEKITLLLIASTLFSNHASSANKDERYTVIGNGNQSCGKFIAAANEGTYQKNWKQWNEYYTYMQGYLTGLNQYIPDNKNILGGTDQDGAMAYLEKYCRDNPLSSYMDALDSLVTELYPKRSK